MRDTTSTPQTAMAADTKPLSMRIVDKLASRNACDPIEMEPLANSIDPEALDQLMDTDSKTSVSFEHAGFTVQVTSSEGRTSIDLTRNVHLYD